MGLYEVVVKGYLYVTFTSPLRNFTNLRLYATLEDSVKSRKGFTGALRNFAD